MYRTRFARVFVTIVTAFSLACSASAPLAYAQESAVTCKAANFSCSVTPVAPYYRVGPCTCTVSGIAIAGTCIGINTCRGIATPQPPPGGSAQAPTGLQQLGYHIDSGINAFGEFVEPVTSFAAAHPYLTMGGMMIGSMLLSNVMSGGGSSGGGQQGGAPTTKACTTQYFYTSDPQALTDPCAIYSANETAGSACRATTYYTSDINAMKDPCAIYKSTNTGTCTSVHYHTSDVSALTDPCAIYDSGIISPTKLANPACPIVVTVPNCSSGMVPRDNGYDYNGCKLASTCEASTGIGDTGSIDRPIDINTGGGTPWLGSSTIPYGGTPTLDTSTVTEVPMSQVLNTTTYYNDTTSTSTLAPSQTPLNRKDTPLPANGLHGDIRSFGGGATIYASSRTGNTEVAGFYGSTSTAGKLCQSRPWATNFLSFVIPAAFFDNLCSWGGYPTGITATGGGTGVGVGGSHTTSIGSPIAPAITPISNVPQAAAKIWARPAKVNIGGRTTIFWVSQNVTACTESSSDGNFSGSSTSGGASTVALSGPVTFTMQCRALDGAMISNSTTVTIGT